MTAIEWTDATWNPTTGCSKVSPGCAHCYAETLSLRFGWSKKPWTPEHAAENVVLHPERLNKPLTWRKPRMVFVNSMSDLFHEEIPDEFIFRVLLVMREAERHTFQVLTKRPERARDLLTHWYRCEGAAALGETPDDVTLAPGFRGYENVWIGTSIENARHASRADALRETPAAVRFISAEPLLGSLFTHEVPGVDVLRGIDWVIAGGESGATHRPMDPEWAREIRDACRAFGVAFFFKQWGGRTPKSGGRMLDGREWSDYPITKPAPVSAAIPTPNREG